MTIQHTVVFRLVHERGSSAESWFLDEGRSALTAIPGVTDVVVNQQVSPRSSLDWQLSMVFADQAAYNTHPAQVAFVAERWETEVEEFCAYDVVAR